VIAEEVGDDREEDPDPNHEEEDLDDQEKQFAEADICERQVGFLSESVGVAALVESAAARESFTYVGGRCNLRA
jgi:hypothetical protein